MKKSTKKQKKYEMLDPIQHIIQRSDMYVGSKRPKVSEEYCISDLDLSDNMTIVKKTVTYPPALLRIFVEILSNAVDNVQRSLQTDNPCKVIKISIDKNSGLTTVWNDGEVIPVEKDADHNMYLHTMLFGNLRTGENYNDDDERLVSGRNGLGSKATNVFSSSFTVKGQDPKNQKKLEQTWTENMRKTSGPVVKSCKLKTGYTEVSYIPDFSQFSIDGYTDDILSVYGKYIVDITMISKVKVYYNGKLLKVPNLLAYSKLYKSEDSDKKENLHIKNNNSEVVVTPSSSGFQAISFVNGVYTKNGGIHVDSYCEALFRPIVKKINDKNKSRLTIADVKAYFRIFVVTQINNPEFESQEKHCLMHPKVEAIVDKKDTDKLLKWSVFKDIENYIKLKNNLSLTKIEKKTTSFVRIDKLDDAQNAGTKKGYECSLVLTEGDSAATFAHIGLETGLYGKKGKEYIGVLSLFGKVLNCRNATSDTILKNKVVSNLVQAIGLKQGVDYTDDENWKKLRYGRVVALGDADCDGVAIVGLLLNFFHYLYPSLLKRSTPFIVNMLTPVVRILVSKGNDILFYEENRFREYAKTKTPEWLRKHSQYYKGLGSSDKKDIKDLFGKKIMEFQTDDQTDNCMIKVYDKKHTDSRKQWLEYYNPSKDKPYNVDNSNVRSLSLSVTDFLENEVITFSWENCKRSLPHLMDGLKCSQRKALFGTFKSSLYNDKPPMKVAQLGAYVAKETCYHHGEASLFETITKMAQNFVNSNNIPLLDRKGNFGSRRLLGQDSAQPRYIFTRLDKLTHIIFRKEDEPLLEYINEDGDSVEPSFYVPIIPMILVNGALGLGTGYSSSVPLFNPLDVIQKVTEWIENNDSSTEIYPWYRGFTGNIQKDKEKYICYGSLKRINDITVQVSEIPVDMSIDSFKTFLEDMQEKKTISSFKNDSTTENPLFTITENKNGPKLSIENLKLKSYLHVTNMVLFGTDNKLKKYDIQEIIDVFCSVRLDYYKKRKIYLLDLLEKEIIHTSNKLRFIRENIQGTIDMRNIQEDKLIESLKNKDYNTHEGKYDYLLNMPMRSLTENMLQKLEKELLNKQQTIQNIRNTSEKDIWKKELNELQTEYKNYIKNKI